MIEEPQSDFAGFAPIPEPKMFGGRALELIILSVAALCAVVGLCVVALLSVVALVIPSMRRDFYGRENPGGR